MSESFQVAWTPERAVDLAEQAALWIDQYKSETSEGVVWGKSEQAPQARIRNFYYGSAGIALFLLELHQATGKQSYYDDAVAAGHDVADYITKKSKWTSVNILNGLGGYAFSLIALAERTGIQSFSDAAETVLKRICDQSTEIGVGRGWIEQVPFPNLHPRPNLRDREIQDLSMGSAGAGLVLLYALDRGLFPAGLALAEAAGDRLLEVGERMKVGKQWIVMDDQPFEYTAPNFGHGGAGVGYFLTRLHQHSPKQKYLDGAISAAEHLLDIAQPVGEGKLVQHFKHGEHAEQNFYLGRCHGPAGTSRLFYMLSHLTGDEKWSAFNRDLLRGVEATGAPESRTYGMWNNVSQCCCDAGVGDYALHMYRYTRDISYLELARRVAGAMHERAVIDDAGARWPQAEQRTDETLIETQTGYMQGAAGVASFYLHFAFVLAGQDIEIGSESGLAAKIALPDEPFDRVMSI